MVVEVRLSLGSYNDIARIKVNDLFYVKSGKGSNYIYFYHSLSKN